MSERAAAMKTHEDRKCPRCDAQPSLVRTILDSRSGKSISMFECKCGAHIWSERSPQLAVLNRA